MIRIIHHWMITESSIIGYSKTSMIIDDISLSVETMSSRQPNMDNFLIRPKNHPNTMEDFVLTFVIHF
jgi:hypothetical protein